MGEKLTARPLYEGVASPQRRLRFRFLFLFAVVHLRHHTRWLLEIWSRSRRTDLGVRKLPRTTQRAPPIVESASQALVHDSVGGSKAPERRGIKGSISPSFGDGNMTRQFNIERYRVTPDVNPGD